VPEHFSLHRPVDLTRAIEAGVIGHERLAELSPVVFDASSAGDPVAHSIVDRQADELVAMAGAIIRRLHLRRLDPDVVLAGGVFAARDGAFEARIRAGIERIAPRATVRRSDALPVLGAALLGLDRVVGADDARHGAATERLRAGLGAWRPVSVATIADSRHGGA
jgi:N-acetylglucosamine kinase-like BadF-type ATPase